MADTTIYIINRTDGTAFAIQPRAFDGPGGIQTSSDLTLYGNATPSWGEKFNENFYRVLESSACPPKTLDPNTPQDEIDLGVVGSGINTPVPGQLWFNSTTKIIHVYNGSTWDAVGAGTITDIPGLQDELDAKVDKAGDTMSDTLVIESSGAFKGLDVTSPSHAYIQVSSTAPLGGASGYTLYNFDNDQPAGGTLGIHGYTRLINRDSSVFAIERSDDYGVTSTNYIPVLNINQNPGSINDGEMFYYGGGAGAYNGDIRLPNASITENTHVATKLYVDNVAGSGGGVASVNGDSGPVVTLSAADFPDIYSKTEVDSLIGTSGSYLTTNTNTLKTAGTLRLNDDIYFQFGTNNDTNGHAPVDFFYAISAGQASGSYHDFVTDFNTGVEWHIRHQDPINSSLASTRFRLVPDTGDLYLAGDVFYNSQLVNGELTGGTALGAFNIENITHLFTGYSGGIIYLTVGLYAVRAWSTTASSATPSIQLVYINPLFPVSNGGNYDDTGVVDIALPGNGAGSVNQYVRRTVGRTGVRALDGFINDIWRIG